MAEANLLRLLAEPSTETRGAYGVPFLRNSALPRQKQKTLLLTASWALRVSVAKVHGSKGTKKQRWVSRVFQRDISHWCVYASNPRVINRPRIVGQPPSNDGGSWESVLRRIGRSQPDSKGEIAVIG